jgi:aryl-alcohol dehydrogenase-like predicted oxidoreductase
MVEDLRPIAAKYDCSVGELSIAWALRHPAVTSAIVGLRNRGQLDGVLKSATLNIDPADVQQIEDLLSKHGL